MERIKEALEKARGQRPKQPAGSMVPDAQQVGTPAPFEPHELEKLNYEHTRTTTLDHAWLEKHRIVALNKNERASWTFDLLRTQVMQRMEERGWRTLAVVSPTPEAGKSVVSINLAMSIARQSHKTALLVDFDLRRPKVGEYLGLSMEKTLNEYFSGQADLSEIMVNPEIPRFVVLPTGRPVPKSAELLSSPQTQTLINELRERYDSRIVIFDLPPVLSADDAIAVLPMIDCVLLVVGNGMSKPVEIEETMRYLNSTNLLGVVLNKSEVEQAPHYY